MENARAAKEDRKKVREVQARFRSGSKDRDGTRLKHVSYPYAGETAACISEGDCTSN
jgi:hypothetical protein